MCGFPAKLTPMSQQEIRSIVIAGGGILGANLAYQFARRGSAVTLVEKQRPAAGR